MDSKEAISKEVGNIIRKHRQEKNYTIRDLAAKAEISPTMLNRIELGQRAAKPEIIYKLCKILNCPTSTLNELLKIAYPNFDLFDVGNLRKLYPAIETQEQADTINSIILVLIEQKPSKEEGELLIRLIQAIK